MCRKIRFRNILNALMRGMFSLTMKPIRGLGQRLIRSGISLFRKQTLWKMKDNNREMRIKKALKLYRMEKKILNQEMELMKMREDAIFKRFIDRCNDNYKGFDPMEVTKYLPD